MRFALLLLLCTMPMSANAAVVISEIAWMGTAQDPNGSYCEWIELGNSGSEAVSLEGWVLAFGSVSVLFDASSLIDGNGYFVIERYTENACPDPVSGISDLSASFGSGISNAGAVLKLTRPDGSLEDQVAGGENWESVGGDNTTKETAQKTSSGWKTAAATPGRTLGLAEIEEEEEENEEEENEDNEDNGAEEVDSSEGGNKIIELKLPNATLGLSLLAPDVAYVHQAVSFDVTPTGLGETFLHSLAYEWNYGDFTTQLGKTGKHTYDYPGEYVVTVHAEYGRHAQVARKTIKVLPVDFALTLDAKGNVLLQNDAKYEVNISGYMLKGSEQMTFPERSVILAGGTIPIPKAKVARASFLQPITLYDQKGELVASTHSAPVSPLASLKDFLSDVSEAPLAEASDSSFEESAAEESGNFSFGGEVTEESEEPLEIEPSGPEPIAMAEQAGRASFPNEALPLLGLLGIVTLGLIAVFASGRKNTTE
jgi:hypothetical protein